MKNGQVPMYVMRFVPQEYLEDEFVKGMYLRRQYVGIAFYSAFLFKSHAAGGSLPADVGSLGVHLLLPKAAVEIGKRLAMEAGKLVEEDGRLFHRRVKREVEEFEALRLAASISGKKGAEARINKDSHRVPQANPEGYPKLETRRDETSRDETGRVEPRRADAPLSPPSPEPPNGRPPGDQYGAPGELEQLQAEATTALTETARVVGIPPDELLAIDSRTPNGKSILNVASCHSVRWLRTLTSKLTERRFQFEAQQRANGPPSNRRQTAAAVTTNAMQQILAEEAAKHDRSGDVHGRTRSDGPAIESASVERTPRRLPPRDGG